MITVGMCITALFMEIIFSLKSGKQAETCPFAATFFDAHP
jgi:hypothetical protein